MRMPGQDRPWCSMSGLVSTKRACGADPLPLGRGRVAVVRARADALEAEAGDGAQLVGGERLGRREVERGGPGVGEQVGQHGQLVGQGLAGRRCRWRPRRARRRGPARPPRPGAARARRCRARPARPAARRAPSPATVDGRARRGPAPARRAAAVRPVRAAAGAAAQPGSSRVGRTPENCGTSAARVRRAGQTGGGKMPERPATRSVPRVALGRSRRGRSWSCRWRHASVSDHTVLEIGGEIDVYTAPRLRERLIEMVDAGERHVVVDLGRVEFLDSTGLGVLVGAHRRLRAGDGSLEPGLPARAAAEDLPDHRPGPRCSTSTLGRGRDHRRRPRPAPDGTPVTPTAPAMSTVHLSFSPDPAYVRTVRLVGVGGGPPGRGRRRAAGRGAAGDRRGVHPGRGAAPAARPGRPGRGRDDRRRPVHRPGDRPRPGASRRQEPGETTGEIMAQVAAETGRTVAGRGHVDRRRGLALLDRAGDRPRRRRRPDGAGTEVRMSWPVGRASRPSLTRVSTPATWSHTGHAAISPRHVPAGCDPATPGG